MVTDSSGIHVNDETFIPWNWIRAKANYMCFTCKNAADGRKCPWARENPTVPPGAITYVSYGSTKIILCPIFHHDAAKKPITLEEFKELKDEVIKHLYSKSILTYGDHTK